MVSFVILFLKSFFFFLIYPTVYKKHVTHAISKDRNKAYFLSLNSIHLLSIGKIHKQVTWFWYWVLEDPAASSCGLPWFDLCFLSRLTAYYQLMPCFPNIYVAFVFYHLVCSGIIWNSTVLFSYFFPESSLFPSRSMVLLQLQNYLPCLLTFGISQIQTR